MLVFLQDENKDLKLKLAIAEDKLAVVRAELDRDEDLLELVEAERSKVQSLEAVQQLLVEAREQCMDLAKRCDDYSVLTVELQRENYDMSQVRFFHFFHKFIRVHLTLFFCSGLPLPRL